MGYDMHWVTKDPGEEEAAEAARAAFYAACNVRDALPKDSRGHFTADEWKLVKAGELSHDDYPANVTAEYRAAQDEVRRLSRELDKANRSYFRLNIWGMGNVRRAMAALGAAYGDYTTDERPEYPDDIPDEYYEDEDAPQFAEVRQQVQAYKVWSPRADGEGGLPLHKVGSNDGWLVTPQECFVAAQTIRATDTAVVLKTLIECGIDNEGWLETWNDWVQWVSDASEHGGFEVH